MTVRYLAGPILILAVASLAACGHDKEAPAQERSDVQTSSVSAAAPTTSQAATEPSVGEKTYQATCVMCHGSPAVGAPVVGNKADWAPRIAQGKDVLYKHALEGFNGEKGAMPARGANPSLSDEAVKAAVDFMVGKAQ